MTHLLENSQENPQQEDDEMQMLAALGNNGDGAIDAEQLAGIDRDMLTVTDQLIIRADNERSSPEILQYPGELLAQVQAHLKARTDDIQTMRRAALTAPKREAAKAEYEMLGFNLIDEGAGAGREEDDESKVVDQYVAGVGGSSGGHAALSSSLPFRIDDLLNLEITRVKYAFADLIRVRLQKLQFFRESIAAEPSKYAQLLSEEEMTLVIKMQELFQAALWGGGIGQLPEHLRATPAAALPKAETGSTYVLATALEECEVPLQGLDVPQLMKSGSSILCPYSAVRHHVQDEKMKLMC